MESGGVGGVEDAGDEVPEDAGDVLEFTIHLGLLLEPTDVEEEEGEAEGERAGGDTAEDGAEVVVGGVYFGVVIVGGVYLGAVVVGASAETVFTGTAGEDAGGVEVAVDLVTTGDAVGGV